MASQPSNVRDLVHIDAFKRSVRCQPSNPSRSGGQYPSPRALSAHSHAKLGSGGTGISSLSSDVARQVRSAHIVLDMSAIIKELVENSLDAGAGNIDIRVRGKAGLDSITVSDNGAGIASGDHAALCLPGTTSKLRQFRDLGAVTTFGFRGEALSAICALSKSVSVVTRTKSDTTARNLEFGSDGSFTQKKACARPPGTTVIVEGLFANLPVRRKDALRNTSREVARAIAVVQSLAIISINTRIELRLSNDLKVLSQPLSRSEASPGSLAPGVELDLTALRRTAESIIGSRTAKSLAEVCLKASSDSGLKYGCSGLVSSAALDSNGSGGRARSLHQYIYANRRPVDMPRLVKAITEAYRRSTGLASASPVLVLNLDLPEMSADVNLAPDKRTLFVQDEGELIEGIVDGLNALWAPKDVISIPLREIDFSFASKERKSRSTTDSKNTIPQSADRRDNNDIVESIVDRGAREDNTIDLNMPACPSSLSDTAVEQQKLSGDPKHVIKHGSNALHLNSHAGNRSMISDVHNQNKATANEGKGVRTTLERTPELSSDDPIERNVQCNKPAPEATKVNGLGKPPVHEIGSGEEPGKQDRLVSNHKVSEAQTRLMRLPQSILSSKRDVTTFISRRSSEFSRSAKRLRRGDKTPPSPINRKNLVDLKYIGNVGSASNGTDDVATKSTRQLSVKTNVEVVHTDLPSAFEKDNKNSPPVVVKVDWDDVCQYPNTEKQSGRAMPKVGFHESSLSHANMQTELPAQAQAAQQEMSRLFRQQWFLDLKVLGQFNRGFIICALGSDLFIVDQHASDEKYNFEDLQKNTVISRQTLVRPLALEFSAQDELLVLQHLDGFKAGGFGIEYRAKNKPTKRLFLTSQPVSKHTMFVEEDLQDIVASLKVSAPHSSSSKAKVLRPSRVRAMFASRACRKSIMIGTALKRAQMERVVRNLATIEHPWTCPHGRPTMRHLCALS